jgi:putative transposase
MGSVADAYDNALAETFFATLKTELIYTRSWASRHELETEGFYNPRRRHSRLGKLSPDTSEDLHHRTQATPRCPPERGHFSGGGPEPVGGWRAVA